MTDFKIPKQALEQTPAKQEAAGGIEAATDNFQVPDQAVRDLGAVAGQASIAGELLQQPSEQTPELGQDDDGEELALDEWTRERDSVLGNMNFSFIDGATREVYEQLGRRRQKKVSELAQRLIECYADRGVGRRSVGLLMDNTLSRRARIYGAGSSMNAFNEDEIYVICMGRPLDDRQIDDHKESMASFVTYRWRRYPVRNFMDMPAGETYGGPLELIPMLNDGEWLPAILATTRHR